MKSEKEISALIKLLDDPDSSVFELVSNNLIQHGPDIIPKLEEAWEFSANEFLQNRIENLIQNIQQSSTSKALFEWNKAGAISLLEGAFLVEKYQYPDLVFSEMEKKIEGISKDIWLELNKNLTALENTRVLNLIFFKTYKFSGNFTNLLAPQNNFINQLLETKKGNPLSLGILYSVLAQRLGLPIYGVNLPRNFLLVYLDEHKSEATYESDLDQHVLFYINPFRRGAILNRTDIEHFLTSQKIKLKRSYFIPGSNKTIIKRLIMNLVSSYEKLGYQDKVDNFNKLLNILS